ncbi:hypothetical protein QTN47_04675 [Danxiaibacter flavus]|uniref:Uncharacterized protein n=1 Tax=Danxiaibacter flavus TaxID=3049108 RepID=A0ABV3ZB96_9BACT|nr:hypothetical protein QNM32_04675 [Chitinophagaceae bacterium DXS]
MPKIILDIPVNKMHPVLSLIAEMGLEPKGTDSGYETYKWNSKKSESVLNNKLNTFALLFDWEFFENELEFE